MAVTPPGTLSGFRSYLISLPDLGETELTDIAAEAPDKAIDGVIVSNTTLARDYVEEHSLMPVRPAAFRENPCSFARPPCSQGCESYSEPETAIVGVGGVDKRRDGPWRKSAPGPDLVQLYTGMIYAGPTLPGRWHRQRHGAVRRSRRRHQPARHPRHAAGTLGGSTNRLNAQAAKVARPCSTMSGFRLGEQAFSLVSEPRRKARLSGEYRSTGSFPNGDIRLQDTE